MHIAAETFFLAPSGQGTLQQQIQKMFIDGILSGRFAKNDRLPSSRTLARQLGVSRITVTVAYNELVADDYVIAKGRSGYFVSETAPQPPQFTKTEESDTTDRDWSRIVAQTYTDQRFVRRPADWRQCKFPFIYGQADPRLFDHKNWRQCAIQALGQRDFPALTNDYYEHDDPLLIDAIRQIILPRRGISAGPHQILLTMGAQNALWITTQLLLTQRRTAAVENPCYPELREILSHSRCRTVDIDVDENGIPPANLPPMIDTLFTTVSHQCPTNVTMPLKRRHELLRLANDRGFNIVEDDYEFEMAFEGSPSPALKSLDETGAVIYIGSFSKSLFPGLRLGYIVASESFIREARALRGLVLRHPPGLEQRTTAYFLSQGHYDAQINRMRKVLKKRREAMEQAINDNNLQIANRATSGGSSLWMQAPASVNTRELAQRLYQQKAIIEPGEVFFAPNQAKQNFYRLAYSSISAAQIPEGIALIRQALDSFR